MSVYWMGAGGIANLSTMTIEKAMEQVREFTELAGGYGFIGWKRTKQRCPSCSQVINDGSRDEVIQWRPGEEWEEQVLDLLERAAS